MKYVPSLPPPVTGIEAWRDARALTAVKRTAAAKPVQPRTLQPLVIPPHGQAAVEPLQEVEKREPEHESRRKYCRRVHHQPMLEELRSGVERRKNRQRGDDDIDHIDEEV